jgi:hypothetical protein
MQTMGVLTADHYLFPPKYTHLVNEKGKHCSKGQKERQELREKRRVQYTWVSWRPEPEIFLLPDPDVTTRTE